MQYVKHKRKMLYLILLLPLLTLFFIVLFEKQRIIWRKIHPKTCNKANKSHETDIMPMMRDKSNLWHILHKV